METQWAAARSGDGALCAFAASLRWEDIPDRVRHEAKRSLMNIFATALAGSREPAVDIMVETTAAYSGPATSTVIGRSERLDAPSAACVNAMAANIFDFDDTHEATIIHPASVVFAPIFARAEAHPFAGIDALRAFVIGGEVLCRIGLAVSPYHYSHGWHITSTCGAFGAAAASGALFGLDAAQMNGAFATAAAQSSGLVDTLGTMAKSASVGGAARNGLIAADLASRGFSGPAQPLTGARGYLAVYGDKADAAALSDDLGHRWEIADNAYKPYPVGVVLNPVLDACLELYLEEEVRAGDVASVDLIGHPLLQQRTDRPDIATGREAQVSAQHAIAMVLTHGRAGLAEFTDAAVAETAATGRPEVRFRDEAGRDVASAVITLHLKDGRSLTREVQAARGSKTNPLTDSELEAKLATLAEGVGFTGEVEALIEAIWTLDDAPDAGEVVRLAAGG
ncbi:MmgE/PrpD family protein [Thalassobaculum sp. OXR-137]|uniref:MmgE/PrpD family protein n=1 Tax=Thalassobaculum sp. OXR-137 TaxID=3100173 RepID=UPI002AC912D2|nr:MmgE/PrpD family protein [Thalassobaculum sp. OXR-137]WPZ32630.1 MmgE/PrpD family protein [Thalassobaculum sp. OXR-137]